MDPRAWNLEDDETWKRHGKCRRKLEDPFCSSSEDREDYIIMLHQTGCLVGLGQVTWRDGSSVLLDVR